RTAAGAGRTTRSSSVFSCSSSLPQHAQSIALTGRRDRRRSVGMGVPGDPETGNHLLLAGAAEAEPFIEVSGRRVVPSGGDRGTATARSEENSPDERGSHPPPVRRRGDEQAVDVDLAAVLTPGDRPDQGTIGERGQPLKRSILQVLEVLVQ